MNVLKYLNLVNEKWEQNYSVPVKLPWKIPSMLLRKEKKLLCYLTEIVFTGEGSIIDLGCFLGGSTSFLAQGLINSNKNAVINSFDLFELGKFERDFFFPKFNLKLPDDDNFEKMFLEYTKPYRNLINHNAGNILNYNYSLGNIELLFIDLMKSSQIYDHILKEFFPNLIPGKSLVILQDYYFKNTGIWHQVLPFLLKEHLSYLTDTVYNSAVFLCIKEITQSDIKKCLWEIISTDIKIESIFYALNFCTINNQKQILKQILKSNLSDIAYKKGEVYNTIKNH